MMIFFWHVILCSQTLATDTHRFYTADAHMLEFSQNKIGEFLKRSIAGIVTYAEIYRQKCEMKNTHIRG